MVGMGDLYVVFHYSNVRIEILPKAKDCEVEDNLNLVERVISYRAVNIPRLGYGNQLVPYKDIICVCSWIHTTMIHTVGGFLYCTVEPLGLVHTSPFSTGR